MKIANAKKSVSLQLRINQCKGQLEHSHTFRSTKKKIKSQIPKWKLKNQFKTFDDLLVLLDTFGYLSDDETNKSKFNNMRQENMWRENWSKQEQTQATNDNNNKKFPQKQKAPSENSKKLPTIVRKPTLDELKLVETSQDDLIEEALQLEAFYFWVSQIGCCISPIFSLSPILSYYLYSILLFDLKGARFLIQNDNQLIKIKRQLTERQQLINKIINYSIQKSDANYIKLDLEGYQSFLSIIPQNITFQYIDIDTIIDDFTLYSQQYIDYLKNGDSQQQIGKILIHNQNNIVLGYIRFNFITEQAENIKFRYPISKFDNDQCLDYFEIMERYNLLEKIKQDYKQLMQFINQKNYHSEMTMLLWLIQDAINIQTIFNQLEQSFINKEINVSQLILKSIQLDITSKNKICDDCVNMFNSFPIKFYCEQMLKRFKFKIKSELYLIINSQFFQDPQQKDGQQLYMEPTVIEIIDEQIKVIDEKYELEQSNPQQQNQQQVSIFGGQDQNQIIQSNQQIIQQDQQEIIRFNSPLQQENISQTHDIKQQKISKCEQFLQQSEKISYYVFQIEQEITGLISKKIFDYRYRQNGIPIKKKMIQIPLENTFFISSCIEEENSKLVLSSDESLQLNEQKNPSQIKSEKNSTTCLFCDLQQIQEFKKIKQIQLEKIKFEQKLIEKRKNNITSQKLIDDFKTKFISSITIYYCYQSDKKNFFLFQIDQLSYLIQQIVLQNIDNLGMNKHFYNKIKPYFTDLGIIFNEKIDKRLLLKDYIFFKERVTPFIDQIQYFDNEINNELAIQLLQFDNVQHLWSTLKLDNKYPKIINNCKEFFAVIQSTLWSVSQQGQFKYYLIICNLYEIDNKCKKYLVDQINTDDFINKLDITIHFESINLIFDKQNYKKQTISFSQQQQSQIDIRFGQANLLNVENFMNRYQQQNDFERNSFKDTQEFIQNFSCFNCQDHDKEILRQAQKDQE